MGENALERHIKNTSVLHFTWLISYPFDCRQQKNEKYLQLEKKKKYLSFLFDHNKEICQISVVTQ